ncbi:hypothetical protein BASA81_002129 [Batrachochytrium salamandrivorans]|nr:hypothetical protein BASA81_002129 [Batrachochytrium salamandrivorans]
MRPPPTAYDVLGVSSSASLSEIKARYRVLVLKFHPDVDGSPEGNMMFVEIQASYEHFDTEATRAAYDRKLHREGVANDPNFSPPPRRGGGPGSDDWWTQSSTAREYARQRLEQLRLDKRKQFEAKSTTFRWPTGESFEQMDSHQQYFYFQMTRQKRSMSTFTRLIK